eukprot:CAMPEP_0195056112 /NCGR_PEP_ID=MMETSP0448-20130528/4656_1 /TAXON_ID=66468 /ORGANISM="Heterocapsa triquestra, Strain CCMP 448" /LENGTH=43 /DNA_ID= /DNA_START= /DNA_END= /DNA_ORIENTATION=
MSHGDEPEASNRDYISAAFKNKHRRIPCVPCRAQEGVGSRWPQ